MSEQQQAFFRLWEAACADASTRPSVQVIDGHFQLRVTGRAHWAMAVELSKPPLHAERTEDGEVLTVRWPSHSDAIFGADGLIAQRLDRYEVRQQQLQMARLIQRAIEMEQPAVIEAGTGVGKSFAYAAVCMAMGRKLVISTSNKALQAQLMAKDLPFLQQLFPGKSIALKQGKSNYACNLRGNAHTFRNQELAAWFDATEDGNVESIEFPVEWKELSEIVVDDDCGGKHCGFYFDCHYYAAKDRCKVADVVVTNHALLCLHELYPNAGILPVAEVLVVDEAHKLADYARGALGVEFRLSSVAPLLNGAQPYLEDIETMHEALLLAAQFERQVRDYLASSLDAKTGLPPALVALNDTVFSTGSSLALTITDLANEVWAEDDLPVDTDDRKLARRASRLRTLAGKIAAISTPGVLVRWLESAEPITCKAAPSEVADFIGAMAGFTATPAEPPAPHTHCARCHRTLTAERVAILDGRPYGPECIKHVDALGDAETFPLNEWLGQDHAVTVVTSANRPVIFCSATLAAPDLSAFMREAGLRSALQMVAGSPFDYANNALLYLPSGAAPQPSDPQWRAWAVAEMDELVRASGGGAFLLFTSYAMMNYAAQILRGSWLNRYQVMVQGELPKLEIAKRFREDGNAVLLATKSFFEGVSIDGSALRLVVVDKMPFEAPNPLSAAMEAEALAYARNLGYSGRMLEMYPFDHLRVPRMIIELKQAAGRLIRTATDTGVIAVLDSRLRSAQYGRNKVIPALPPAPVMANTEVVKDFLRKQRPAPPVAAADVALAKILTAPRAKITDVALPLTKTVTYEDDGGVLWA